MAEKKEFKKVLTPPFRMSYPHLFKPYSMDGKDPKYQLAMLFPKKADLRELMQLAKQIAIEEWGEPLPKGLKWPFLNGDDQNDENSHGCILIRTATSRVPSVIGINKKKDAVISEKDVIPGFWARATVNCYAWTHRNAQGKIMKQGVSFGLQNVQLLPIEAVIALYKGQNLFYELTEESFVGNSGPAEADFDAIDMPSENPGNYETTSGDWMNDDIPS